MNKKLLTILLSVFLPAFLVGAVVSATTSIGDAVSVDTTLAVTGATTLSSTLAVTGASTLTGALTVNNKINVHDQQNGAASNGPIIRKTLQTGEDYTGTVAGLMVKNYFASTTSNVSSGEFTGLYVNVKQLRALSGDQSSIISGHNYGTGGDYQALHAGIWLYGDLINAFKVSNGTSTNGINFSQQTITGSDIILSDGATIANGDTSTLTITEATVAIVGDLTVSGTATISGSLVFPGAATGLDHPINMNSITAMTGDETTDCGNVLKISRSAGAIGGTHSGVIVKNYITGGNVDGTALVSGLYVNLKYEPTSENVAAEVSLMQTHLYSDSSDAIDYGWYTLAPDSKINALLGVSGDMTYFMEVKGDGNAGMTVSPGGMHKDPTSDAEAGYITIRIEGGEIYQIPFYDAD